jgi:hypothetical protein
MLCEKVGGVFLWFCEIAIRAANRAYKTCCVAILAAVSAANVSISNDVTPGYMPRSIDLVRAGKFNFVLSVLASSQEKVSANLSNRSNICFQEIDKTVPE